MAAILDKDFLLRNVIIEVDARSPFIELKVTGSIKLTNDKLQAISNYREELGEEVENTINKFIRKAVRKNK